MNPRDFAPTRIHWPDHFSNGGTGISKFKLDQLPRFKRLVEEYGSKDVWIKDDCELHTTLEDLSDFWRLDEKLTPKQ